MLPYSISESLEARLSDYSRPFKGMSDFSEYMAMVFEKAITHSTVSGVAGWSPLMAGKGLAEGFVAMMKNSFEMNVYWDSDKAVPYFREAFMGISMKPYQIEGELVKNAKIKSVFFKKMNLDNKYGASVFSKEMEEFIISAINSTTLEAEYKGGTRTYRLIA